MQVGAKFPSTQLSLSESISQSSSQEQILLLSSMHNESN
jgi:hypothetical protein